MDPPPPRLQSDRHVGSATVDLSIWCSDLLMLRQALDGHGRPGEDCAMINQITGRNHEYTCANLTSVVVAETTSQLLHESFLADRELTRIGKETTSFDAYAVAEAKSRDAISKFYGFLIRFAAARLSSESELLERAAYCSARVKRSHDRIEASRPEWFVAQMALDPTGLAKAS